MQAIFETLAAQLFQGITLIKIVAAVVIVVTLSVLAERVSPKFAGIFSGYPLGAAITLFFIGYEVGPEFAARSAIYTIIGILSAQIFIYFYYLASRWSQRSSRLPRIAWSSGGGLAGYTLAAFGLRYWPVNLMIAAPVALASIFFFDRLFRRIPNVIIENRKKSSLTVLSARAFFAAVVILLVTSTAQSLGTRWAGLLAAFPVTMFPFLVIIHYSYQNEHLHAVIKNIPRGLISSMLYCLVVSLTYPVLGLARGTAAGYLLATLYLVLINRRRT
ncbi:MAG: DUF3147 family protein [Pseudomonadota bacterium]